MIFNVLGQDLWLRQRP